MAINKKSMAEKKLVAILKGGLGNQLFIYAATKAAACRTGRQLFLDSHTAYLNDTFNRSYQLDRFCIEDLEVPPNLRIAPNLRHWRHKGKRAINKLLPDRYKTYLAERGKNELLNLCSEAKLVYTLGYWQSESYFKDYIDVIRNGLKLPQPNNQGLLLKGEILANMDSVALHIRRDRFPKVVDLDYYQIAIDKIVNLYPEAQFILFGDSVIEARAQLNFHGRIVEQSEGANSDDALIDFWLITRCRHTILSNSSFAWWAAWFGDAVHTGRTVIAPADFGFPMEASPRWITLPNLIVS